MTKLLGVVFPGQGSQSVGMLNGIANEYSEVQSTFAEASDVLGYDLWQLVATGPSEELDKTIHTQPALLAASFALWQILKKHKDVKPALLAGHSLGEYTALVCANAIAFKDAIRLVAARGQFMQEAVPVGQGALAAIVGLENEAVQLICDQARQADEVLSPVNFNCPGQVVIGGNINAVERALILAKAQEARLAKLLPVSVPSHCVLMKPAADKLAAMMMQLNIQTPTIPVLNNVDVKVYSDADSIRDGLKRQLFMPVRWVEIIQEFAKMGIQQIIECGPGKVLSGLNKRIAPGIALTSTNDVDSVKAL